jgi:sporulation protein YlmC with PRC-barrel domain
MTTLSLPEADTPNSTLFPAGAKVNCSDGQPCGKLTRVIIDPIQRTLTHLVVEPRQEERGRLVPLHLAQTSTPELIELECTPHEFNQLESAQDTDYFPMDDRYGPYYAGYGHGYGYAYGNAYFLPYYAYGGMGYGHGWDRNSATYDAIPPGEVTIRRGDPVHATDGDIGHIAGLVIGTPAGEVTHVLLQEGHLWGKRDVSIPIGSVTRVGEVVEVGLSKHQLEELPSIDIDHPETGQGPTSA